jgi:hypothetical protein
MLHLCRFGIYLLAKDIVWLAKHYEAYNILLYWLGNIA